MTPKIEINAYDGPGRITKIIHGQNITLSPCIPTFHVRIREHHYTIPGESLQITCFPSIQF
ncbi:MAG: hypothetical protein ACFFCQ_11030, partial [Promethearchaeota archaeon]